MPGIRTNIIISSSNVMITVNNNNDDNNYVPDPADPFVHLDSLQIMKSITLFFSKSVKLLLILLYYYY